MHQLAFRRLELKRADLPKLAMIVAEPFRLAAASAAAEREHWRHSTERRVLQGFQLKRLCVVDSASLCLFANKLTSGVVINIGFGAHATGTGTGTGVDVDVDVYVDVAVAVGVAWP